MKKEKMFYFLYKTTNKSNGKFYIGVHKTIKINDGYLGSGKRLRYSVRKYGKENFLFEILEFFENEEQMYEAEKNFVNLELIKNELCMNLKEGGIGGWTKEQARNGADKANKTKKIRRESDPEWRNRECERNSSNMRLSYESGTREKKQPLDWSGRKHKPETIEKMRCSKNVGVNNSQFGTKWINKDGEVKKIKIFELDNYLKEGWSLGRK